MSDGERRIAALLAAEGYDVRKLFSGSERRADFLIDGVTEVEVKSLRGGATNETVRNRLRDAKRTATAVILDSRGSGLTYADARRGAQRALGAYPGRYSFIRVLLDGDRDYVWLSEGR